MATQIKVIVGLVLVLILAGALLYFQTEAVGKLKESLAQAEFINKQWSDTYDELKKDKRESDARLAQIIEANTASNAKAAAASSTFRKQLRALSNENEELRKALGTAIPGPILGELCRKGYAAAELCQGMRAAK